VDQVQFVRHTWEAISRGDLQPLETSLAPDAKWRAVVDGPWNCENRDAILDVMKGNLSKGLSGEIERRSSRAIGLSSRFALTTTSRAAGRLTTVSATSC
jgi:hypothetical protein